MDIIFCCEIVGVEKVVECIVILALQALCLFASMFG